MIRATGVLDAEVDRQAPKEPFVAGPGALLAREVELEPVGPGSKRSLEEVADAPIAVGQRLRHSDRLPVIAELVEGDVDTIGRHTSFRVEDVSGDRRPGCWRRGLAPFGPVYHAILRAMGGLRIRVGNLNFSARWEESAPQTVEAVRRMLPIERELIHCRWSGESTWIPFGDFRPGLEWENHTSHPAPGMLAIYPGGISECEIFFPYGACTTSSKVGQLATNHFATIEPDDGWQDRLREIGRRCLWEGAQPISITGAD